MASTLPSRPAPGLQPGDVLLVVHDFDARSADELTLRKAERVELIELDDGFGDGWYLGRHLTRGVTGLFPGVYTSKAPSMVRPSAHVRQISLNTKTPAPAVPNANNTPSVHEVTTLDDPTPSGRRDRPTQPSYQYGDGSTTPSFADASKTHPHHRGSVAPPHHATYAQRSIGEALGDPDQKDSPVMHETLHVIDEHITDLSTPRQSLVPPRMRTDDSGSEYSSHLDRQSFVAGPETDDEDNGLLTDAEVRSWDHHQTAQHLREIGVDAKHCDIFEEQEIPGEVLLDMDQSFIHMKEYDFGVMGRRLKTWHKIRDFQEEVKGAARRTHSKQSSLHDQPTSSNDGGRVASRTQPGFLPRIPSLLETSSALPSPLHPQPRPNPMNSPAASWRASMASESPSRVSAAAIREMHLRRHSSVDVDNQPDLRNSSNASLPVHQKQPSFDRNWSMMGSQLATPATSTPTSFVPSTATRPRDNLEVHTPSFPSASPVDMDRGYFSGNEVESRKTRNRLSKRDSAGGPATTHVRQTSSAQAEPARPVANKRHSRLSSVDSIKQVGSNMVSPAAKAYHSSSYMSRFRSASSRAASKAPPAPSGQLSPTVTNLEDGGSSGGASPAPERLSMPEKARRLIGKRAVSEQTGTLDKSDTAQSSPKLEPSKTDRVSTPGSLTPSDPSRSLEIDNNSNTDTAPSLPKGTGTTGARPRPKTKQHTSAYTHGLMKISPTEARKTCDYSGWMKKKSSGIMATWKPRLFILRGRRLSYYYSETDTIERGIIDISGHKVLVANELITSFHATVTGATSSKSPSESASSVAGSTIAPVTKISGTSSRPSFPSGGGGGGTNSTVFFFKLVPPKGGAQRAVQFTKPTVHYFQVDSINAGRKWMGEIMKATIEHDLGTFETTNKQNTISLAKARARRERPPALDDTKNASNTPITEEETSTPDADVDDVDVAVTINNGTHHAVVPPSSSSSRPPTSSRNETGSVTAPVKYDRETGLNIRGLDFERDTDISLREALDIPPTPSTTASAKTSGVHLTEATPTRNRDSRNRNTPPVEVGVGLGLGVDVGAGGAPVPTPTPTQTQPPPRKNTT